MYRLSLRSGRKSNSQDLVRFCACTVSIKCTVRLVTRIFAFFLSKLRIRLPLSCAFVVLMKALLCLHLLGFNHSQLYASVVQSCARWDSRRSPSLVSKGYPLYCCPLCYGTHIRVSLLTMVHILYLITSVFVFFFISNFPSKRQWVWWFSWML